MTTFPPPVPQDRKKPGCLQLSLVGVGAVVIYALVVLAVGWLMQLLWNTVLTDLFGWPVIGYWQSVGLWMLVQFLGHALNPWRGRSAA